MVDFFEIGVIVNSHGIAGHVRVLPSTFDINRFRLLDTVDIKTKNGTVKMKIEQVRFHKQFVILKFNGTDSADDALKLKGGVLFIPREAALPLNEDEYYAADLYGMEVVTSDGEALGVLTNIIETGANDVYCVTNTDKKELLIPAIKQCVLNVDIVRGKMTVHLSDGLR